MKLFLDNKYSFKLVRKNKSNPNLESTKIVSEEKNISDNDKRSFLKFLGIAGVGLVASQVVPQKAEALIMGGTPSTSTLAIKNVANQKINPATEETVATLATEATLSNVSTEATLLTRASESTLSAIKTNSDKFLFDINGNLLTAQTGGASAVTIKDISGAQINPATEESNILLRRLLRQVDSLAVVDSAQRQKITLDSISGSLTLNAVSVVSNIATISSVDYRYMYIDTARNAYANSIRNNLTF